MNRFRNYKSIRIGSVIKHLVLCSALFFGTSAAHAALITGSMELVGSYTDTDLSAATELELISLVNIKEASGSLGLTLTGSPSSPLFGDINTNPLVFDPFTAIPNLLDIGGWQLGLTTLVIDEPRTAESLRLSGTGLLSGNGYDPTDATWSFSAQNLGDTYSMTVTAIPIPAAVWLFGSGLIGLIAVARRKAD